MLTISQRRTPALVFLALAAGGLPVRAGDFVVTRYDDPAPNACVPADCSLREAVIAANALANADRILLSAGTYTLSIAGADEDLAATGDLDVLQDVEIVGRGATMTVLDGGGLDHVLEFREETTDAKLVGVSVRGGSATASSLPAGVALSRGTLVVEDSDIRDNAVGRGIVASLFADLTLRRSTVAANGGTGILVNQTTALLENVTLSANGSRELQLSGAGTIVTCRQCTVNDGPSQAVFVSEGTTLTLENSIVLGSCGVQAGATLTSGGGNLESPGATCLLTQPDDQASVAAPGLTALGDHGGPTPTHDLVADSPAVDSSNAVNCLATDERGVARPADGGSGSPVCDSGAVERSASPPPTPIFHDGFLQGDTEAWSQTQG